MLKRLAWGLKQIIPIIDKLLDITLYDDLKEEWNNFKEIADTNNKLNEGKGKLFNGKVNCKIILTQSTLNGLGVENNNSITCNANSIPNKYALEYSKSFIPKLIEWNKKTLKLVIILGKDASICWGNSINIKKNIFIKNWWGNKDIPIDKNEVLFIHIPHPSGANPTYKKNIKKIVDVLEDRISK